MAQRVIILLALLIALAGPARAQLDGCELEIMRHEQALGIPPRLLQAIGIVESGRRDPLLGTVAPWPWTVAAEGRGRYLASKEAAIEEVRALKRAGVESIDVGCMQVNLKHHPSAFASLEQAFEPASNVAYAAGFLRRLYDLSGSWIEAGGRYHSHTPDLGDKYKLRLMKAWQQPLPSQAAPLLPVALAPLPQPSRLGELPRFHRVTASPNLPPLPGRAATNNAVEDAERLVDAYRRALKR